MAKLIYFPRKIRMNDGAVAWTYKSPQAVENVLGYIMSSNCPMNGVGALGLPLLSVSEMAESFHYTKNVWHKNDGRQIRHEVLAFDDPMESFDLNGQDRIMEIAYCCAGYYYSQGFQTVYTVWRHDVQMVRNTPEIHFAVNTVSLCDGHKLQTNREKQKEQEQYFNSVIQNLTGKNVLRVTVLEDEPDYSDFLFLPEIE